MSKAILILNEMPEYCGGCPLCIETERSWHCGATTTKPHREIIEIRKPIWCPLHPLPQRKEEMDYLATGYNKCLDDIEEGEE